MKLPSSYNIGTHAIHHGEGIDALHAHVQPIYLTSTFSFDDVDVATEVMTGRAPGFSYSRGGNPTVQHLANKYALLEGIDLIRAHPDSDPATLVKAIPFASGMAAISAGILSRVRGGDTLIAQRSLYNTTYQFLTNIFRASTTSSGKMISRPMRGTPRSKRIQKRLSSTSSRPPTRR